MHGYMSLPRLAEYLDVDRSTIYRWVERGRLPKGTRIGKRLKWHMSVIKKWEAEQERKAKAAG